MLEIEHLCPRVTEVGYPRKTGRTGKLPGNQMHGMGRSGAHDDVHRMFAQIFLEKSDGRTHPQAPGVGDEHVPPDIHRNLLLQTFFLAVDGIYLALSGLAFPEDFPVYAVRLEDGPSDDLGTFGDFFFEGPVLQCKVRIFRGIDYRLPSVLRQIFGEFHPPLDAGSAGGRPIICDDKCPFHKIIMFPARLSCSARFRMGYKDREKFCRGGPALAE